MAETETQKSSLNLLMSHYITLALLILLLDKLELNHTVKEHCKIGLKVVGIIFADLAYSMGTDALSDKEFKAFFKLFPASCFNDLGVNTANIILKNIKLCIATDDIVYMQRE